MNIRNIVKKAVSFYLTDSVVTSAIERIIENEYDLEDFLAESDKLKDIVTEELECAIDDAIDDLQ